MPSLIWFEWVKAMDGYRIAQGRRRAPPDDEDEGVTIESINKDWREELFKWAPPDDEDEGVTIENIDEEWERKPRYSLWICPAGRKKYIKHKPLENNLVIFKEFSEIDGSLKSMLLFANKYGLPIGQMDNLYFLDNYISEFRKKVERWEYFKQHGNIDEFLDWYNGLSELELSNTILEKILKKSPDGSRPALYIRPEDLYSAMDLQFAQAITTDAQLCRCAVCPSWFSYGAGTGRRKSSHYCSDRCRKAAYLERQKKIKT